MLLFTISKPLLYSGLLPWAISSCISSIPEGLSLFSQWNNPFCSKPSQWSLPLFRNTIRSLYAKLSINALSPGFNIWLQHLPFEPRAFLLVALLKITAFCYYHHIGPKLRFWIKAMLPVPNTSYLSRALVLSDQRTLGLCVTANTVPTYDLLTSVS